MIYQVNILEQAEQDLLDIYYYVAYHDNEEKAQSLLDKLEESCLSLDNMPERGIIPQELSHIGVIDFLQILCLNLVVIYAVLDGRRDMQQLLEKRFLR